MPVNKRDVCYPCFTSKDTIQKVSWPVWEQQVKHCGGYAFRIHPYYCYVAVIFGSERFIQATRALFYVDLADDVGRSGGMVTRPGNIPHTNNLLAIYLPEKYEAEIFWHEALHAAMMTLERHGVSVREQEALTYLQGFIHNQLQACHDEFLVDKKAGLLPFTCEIFTGSVAELNTPDYYNCHGLTRGRP